MRRRAFGALATAVICAMFASQANVLINRFGGAAACNGVIFSPAIFVVPALGTTPARVRTNPFHSRGGGLCHLKGKEGDCF